MSSEVRSEPNMIVHANNNIVSKRGLPFVCFKCGSASPLPVAEEVSSKFQSAHPVCQECFAKGVRVRTRGQKQMRTWLPHQVTDLAWTLRCVWSQLKKQSLYFCVPVTRCCVRVLGFFFWEEIIFFSVRSVAFLRKMWRETEIKITVALRGFGKSSFLGIWERKVGSCGASWPTPRITQPVRSRPTSMTCKRDHVFFYATQYGLIQRRLNSNQKSFEIFGAQRAMIRKTLLCLSLSRTTTPALWVSVLVVGKETYAQHAKGEQLTFLWRLVDISDSATTTTSPRPGDNSFTNNNLNRLHLFPLLVIWSWSMSQDCTTKYRVTTCATATQLSLVVWHVWRFLVRYNNWRRRRRVDQNDCSFLSFFFHF